MNILEPVVHIVDDDESIRTSLARLLWGFLGYAVKTHASGTNFATANWMAAAVV